MSDKKITVTACPGLCTMMFITFLVLKLTKVIDWSWWWVTAPLWIPLAVGVGLFVILLATSVILAGVSKDKQRPF